jgi:A/G-specific adenine glycosylase
MTVAGQGGRRKRSRQVVRAVDRPSAAALLAWYDRHRRSLPWRAPRGEMSDPSRVWLSEVMLQHTTVKAVGPYYRRFLAHFPSIFALAEAPLEDVLRLWAGLGYYARARNLHACAKVLVERYDGRFPTSETALRDLPGIGAYTAAAIAAIAFNTRATPVDGNIERVVARLYAVEQELPAAKSVIRRLAQSLTPAGRSGDFAQAMMDLGATICTPRKPACGLCPWMHSCGGRLRGEADAFPRKAAKATGQRRHGAAFVVVRADGKVLVRSRPAKGLLGGMTEVPSSIWSHDFDAETALDHAPHLSLSRSNWRRVPGVVRHTFSHFPLELAVYHIAVPTRIQAPPGTRWTALTELGSEALPTVMRKVLAHAGVRARPSATRRLRVTSSRLSLPRAARRSR